MSEITSKEDVYDEASVFETGGWYIAELDDPQLVVQGESRQDALDSLAKRWEEYTTTPSDPPLLGSSPGDDPRDNYQPECPYSPE